MAAETGAAPALTHRAYAGLVTRLTALAIDVALICVAVSTVRLLPEAVWQQVFQRPTPQWLSGSAAVVATLLPWAYFTASWWMANQTVGDLIIGIVVLRRDGGELSLPHAALRSAIGLLLAPLWMVGMIPILWDRRRRAWHDVLLRTVVRYAPKARSASG